MPHGGAQTEASGVHSWRQAPRGQRTPRSVYPRRQRHVVDHTPVEATPDIIAKCIALLPDREAAAEDVLCHVPQRSLLAVTTQVDTERASLGRHRQPRLPQRLPPRQQLFCSREDDGARGGHREGADHVHEYDVELKVAIAYAAEEFGGEAPHPLLLPKAVDERRGDPRRNPAPCDPVGVAQHKLAARPPDKEPHRCKKSAHQPDTLDRVLR
mmetsp:Transcript_8807/g.19597  ORF Transcript_8807/g.19597 Transcript_8807/m.19597 type:complete len:212 (-) Transcript_8807:139-774(-)